MHNIIIAIAPVGLFCVIIVGALVFRPKERYSTFVAQAIGYAQCAHQAQTRKYTGEPYIMHCIEVMEMLNDIGCSDEVLAAAVLHDTVEDTDVTIDQIAVIFGARTAALVAEVTDVSVSQDGNRAARKRIDAAHLARSSRDGATIKLADTISNTASIAAHDPDFSKIYLREKLALLPRLSHGNRWLYNQAFDMVLSGMGCKARSHG